MRGLSMLCTGLWLGTLTTHPEEGVAGVVPVVEKANREVYLLQRKDERLGKRLGKSTGWGLVATLRKRGVEGPEGPFSMLALSLFYDASAI